METQAGAPAALPRDADRAALVGRIWRPDVDGPSIVAIRAGRVVDISAATPTMSALVNAREPAHLARTAAGEDLGPVSDLLANAGKPVRDSRSPWPLAPTDLMAVKACGVTFVDSLLERVIEEQAKGEPAAAGRIRKTIAAEIGIDLSAVRPGSPQASSLKQALIARGVWSQYLEVGIGPDAEVFTKAQPLSAVGTGAAVGIHPASTWNNPEPEIVLIVNALQRIVGATLGNDVNCRDIEGRSALLLGKTKDNNASAAIGPFIRLLDENYTLDDIRTAEVHLRVEGADGFVLEGTSSMTRISRDIAELVGHAMGRTHQYPDGMALFTGTMFAPVKDRGASGQGFTHKEGDRVGIASDRIGLLANTVTTSDKAAPWTFGIGALMANLSRRGLI